MTEPAENGLIGSGIFIFLAGIAVLCLWGCPQYNVYTQRKEGEAQLAKAQYNRQVAVAEANAKYESALLLANADTIRAHGIAQSNQIIGRSLENNPSYLQWLWIDEISKTTNQIIYVPSGQMGLPILEATRLPKPVIPTP
jgi:regulator of protease activity HflC (stomatin/prohibitin superfamily)